MLLQSWQEIVGTEPGETKGEGRFACSLPASFVGVSFGCMGCLQELRARMKQSWGRQVRSGRSDRSARDGGRETEKVAGSILAQSWG